MGRLNADWEVNDNEICFRIKDFSESEKKTFPTADFEKFSTNYMKIAYNEWVILKKK